MTPIPLQVHIDPDLANHFIDRHSLLGEDTELRALLAQLPLLHSHPHTPEHTRHGRRSRRARLYHGRFERSNTGFTYVCLGHTLTILSFWFDGEFVSARRRDLIDCVIWDV